MKSENSFEHLVNSVRQWFHQSDYVFMKIDASEYTIYVSSGEVGVS